MTAPSVSAGSTPPTNSWSAREHAVQACVTVKFALNSDGYIPSVDVWSATLAGAQHGAATAAQANDSFSGLADHLAALAATPPPGATPSNDQNAAYSAQYRPVATDCSPLGVELPTD